MGAGSTNLKEYIMANIGTFTKTGNEYKGEIVTMSVQQKNVRIVPETSDNENAPSHRVFVGRAEIGAAWTKRSNEGRDYLGCLAMAMVGYEEEMRMLAQPTLLPGSESGGFAQDDVASPVFLAWSKQEKAGALLELTLASLAPVAMRAYAVTGRPVPEALRSRAAEITQHFRDDGSVAAMGPSCAALAAAFRAQIYKA